MPTIEWIELDDGWLYYHPEDGYRASVAFSTKLNKWFGSVRHINDTDCLYLPKRDTRVEAMADVEEELAKRRNG